PLLRHASDPKGVVDLCNPEGDKGLRPPRPEWGYPHLRNAGRPQRASPVGLIGSRPPLAQGWDINPNRTEDTMRSRRKLGLAGRAGRWSARHRKTAIWGWIAFVVAAIALGGALGTKTLAASQTGVGESKSADQTLEKGFTDGAMEQVLFQSRGDESARGPQVREAVGAVEAR